MDTTLYSQTGSYAALTGFIVFLLSYFFKVQVDPSGVIAVVSGIVALIGIIKQIVTHKALVAAHKALTGFQS